MPQQPFGQQGQPRRESEPQRGQPLPRGPLQTALRRMQEAMINRKDLPIPEVLAFVSEATSILEYVEGAVAKGTRNIPAKEDELAGIPQESLPQELRETQTDVRVMDISRLRHVFGAIAGPGNYRSILWDPTEQKSHEIPTFAQQVELPLHLSRDIQHFRQSQEAATEQRNNITVDLVQVSGTTNVSSMRGNGQVDYPNERELYLVVRVPGQDPKTQHAIVFSEYTLGAVYFYPPSEEFGDEEQRRTVHQKPYLKPQLIALLQDSFDPKTGEGLVVVPNEGFIEAGFRRTTRTLLNVLRQQPTPALIDSLFEEPLLRAEGDDDGYVTLKNRNVRVDHFNLSFNRQ